MNITTTTEKLEGLKSDLLILPLTKDGSLSPALRAFDKSVNAIISRAFSGKDFSGARGETLLLLPEATNHKRILLLGLGAKKEFSTDKIREIFSNTAIYFKKAKLKTIIVATENIVTKSISADQAAQAATESLLLSNYQFTEYKAKPKETEVRFEPDTLTFSVDTKATVKNTEKGGKLGQIIAEAVNYARDLANHPGNVMTPEKLADAALTLAREHKLKVKVLDKEEMQKLGMGAILAVNQGSALPPKFIILEHKGRGGTPTVLVGKGITFDSGGISIMPS
jgi:leucyl aminopeptidase